MHASREFASERKKTVNHRGEATLLSGVNWLGDSVMTMPAIRGFRRSHPGCHIAMLSKPSLAPLWQMHPAIDLIIELQPWPDGAWQAAMTARQEHFERSFVMTQSFRSALVPFLARIPSRIGMPGHFRDWMLTEVVNPNASEGRQHQVFEYFDLLGVDPAADTESAHLVIPETVSASCRKRMDAMMPGASRLPLVGMLPGAAHGPSKCWPGDYFKKVAHELGRQHGCRIAVFGSPREVPVCASIASGMEHCITDFSGKTSLQELAAMLSFCDVVVANDSGGMHLAAVVGTPVVGIFGITDPGKTGPLGHGHRILAADSVSRSRDLAPDSKDAREAMFSIPPGTVLQAALDILKERKNGQS